jgi:hypothetical protein
MSTELTLGQRHYENLNSILPVEWVGPPWSELSEFQKAQYEKSALSLQAHYFPTGNPLREIKQFLRET